MTVAGGVVLYREASAIPALFWVVIGPIALISGLVLLVVASALAGAFRAGLRPTNWFARLGVENLHLQLRSYRNAHFESEAPTVLELPYRSIQSMRRVVETRRETRDNRVRIVSKSFIELCVGQTDTEPLAAALRAERSLEAPAQKALIGSTRTKHHHYPVTVVAPGRIRIEWRSALFNALKAHVPAEPDERLDFDAGYPIADAEARALELDRRGERFSAVRIVMEHLDVDAREAAAWLDQRDQVA
jgi:hypothetical protein